MHQINRIVLKQPNFFFADSGLCFYVYFDVLSDDGFPIEQNGFVGATVMYIYQGKVVTY